MKYDPRLSQLRFFATFSVALYYLWALKIIPLVFFRQFWLGLPIFFELSIYLLLNRLDENPSIKRYFKRRIKRILPLYFMAVITVFFVDKYVLHLNVTYYDLALHFAFISFVLTPFSFHYIFWTLQLEVWMYLVIPFIHIVSDKTKCRIGMTLILISFIYSFVIVFLPYDEFHLLYFMPPYWLGAYGWGITTYLLQKQKQKYNYIPINNILYIIIGSFILLSELEMLYIKIELVYELYTRFVIYNLILIIFSLLIDSPPAVINKVTVFLGEVSYGIYLWTLLFLELFGAIGIIYGILASIATEFPLRRKEIIERLKSLHSL